MNRLVPISIACMLAAACAPTPGGTPAGGASSKPGTGASASPTATGSPKASAAPATTAPAAAAVGTIEVTLNGERVDLKGAVGSFMSRNAGMLTYHRASFEGPRDPESLEPFNQIELEFEKTKGLKPFVLPSVKNSQERRARLNKNGIEYNSAILTATTKEDTFAYADGRIKGTWTFDAPAGAANQALSTVAITVDLEVPAEIR